MKFIKKTGGSIDNNFVNMLARKYGITKTTASILVSRGYDNEQKLNTFLHPTAKDLISPEMFNDMNKAKALIENAIKNQEHIVIWSNPNCDSICASSIIALELAKLKANISCFIPERKMNGDYLDKETITDMKFERDCKMVIAVGCGLNNPEAISHAHEEKIKVIILDNHNPSAIISKSDAVITPKNPEEKYPFKELSVSNIAVKLMMSIVGIDALKRNIDLAAFGTLNSNMPLIGENRIIIKGGLGILSKNTRPGIKALSKYANPDNNDVDTYMLKNKFGAMIEACCVFGKGEDAVRLLVSNNEVKINSVAEKINVSYEQSKTAEQKIIRSCFDAVSEKKKVYIFYGVDWDTNLLEKAANKIQKYYFAPVFLFSKDKTTQEFKGVGKSIPGIDMSSILNKIIGINFFMQSKEIAFISLKDIDVFTSTIEKEIEKVDAEIFESVRRYDAVLRVKELNKKLAKEMSVFEPTGFGNPAPVFLLKNISMKEILERGDRGTHFSCVIFDDTGNNKAIAFDQQKPQEIEDLDVVVSLSLQKYNDIEYPRGQIKGYEVSQEKIVRDLINAETLYGVRTKEQPLAVLNITDRKIKQFEKAGIFTVQDLVNYFPKKYYDFRETKLVKDVCDKEMCSIIGTIKSVKKSEKMVWANCVDDNGNNFMACWFHQPYIFNTLYEHQVYNFCGTVKIREGKFVQIYPLYWSKDIHSLQTLIPVYKKIPGMSTDYLNTTMTKALKTIINTDYLEEDIVKDFNLLSEYDTYFYMHRPKSDVQVNLAQRRKVFDSLFRFNFILKDKLNVMDFSSNFPVKNNSVWDKIRKLIPYELTPDQNSAIENMYEYMKKGQRLNGLVQGDVGSGKTIVAFFMMALGIDNNFQSCIIAPTEVLANQHYKELHEMMGKLGIEVGLLVGSMKVREKKAVLKGLEDGSIQMVVGTHAVLQDSVKFNNLGLVVIDEQHRFGVNQREKLLDTEHIPHVITMSATPIPRTLSMALYGDNIQVYNIRTKPAGRKPVITKKMYSDKDINEFMLNEIKKGRQCYVVCPLIDDSESDTMTEVKSVSSEAQGIKDYFKDNPLVKISDISGRMKQELIAEEINKFAKNESNILISTTIIEVGVNVPNATVMVIKSSERFGLAQAHQLRGRVGRGQYQSYCLLQTNKDDKKADILCETNDGFEIAKQDLLLRGAGDYIGTQQTGNNKDVMLMIAEPTLYQKISKLNDDIFSNPGRFAMYSYLLEEKKEPETPKKNKK